MPKGIRKACANCIKSRLACDEGRPCQRCIVHQCECVPVARKPRVKKQKIEPLVDIGNGSITLSWIQTDSSSFVSSSDTENLPKITAREVPSPSSPSSPSPSPSPSLSPSLSPLPLSPPQQVPVSQQPPLALPSSLSPPSPLPLALPAPTPAAEPSPSLPLPQNNSQAQQTYENPMSPTQMLSLLLDDKPSALMQEWPDMLQFGDFASGTQAMKEFLLGTDDACCSSKKAAPPAPLPQPKNSTPLFPAPIGIFDKNQYMLLDANMAMAELFGCANVAEFATVVHSLDDIVDPAAAQIAKNSQIYFIPSMPFDRLGVFRTRSGGSKTVEFRVELTEQLVIFSVKSVYDECSLALPEVQPPASVPDKLASSPMYKPLEFLSPID